MGLEGSEIFLAGEIMLEEKTIHFSSKSFPIMRNTTLILIVWLATFIFISTYEAAAQIENQLLTIANWGYTSLNTEQQGKVNSLQQRPEIVNLQYVDIGNISLIQQNGWLDLTIPGKGCTALVKAKHVESSANGDYYWYGTVEKEDGTTEESCSCYDGAINLISIGGPFFRHFQD